MAVKRIVANIAADRVDAANALYRDMLGMSTSWTSDGSRPLRGMAGQRRRSAWRPRAGRERQCPQRRSFGRGRRLPDPAGRRDQARGKLLFVARQQKQRVTGNRAAPGRQPERNRGRT